MTLLFAAPVMAVAPPQLDALTSPIVTNPVVVQGSATPGAEVSIFAGTQLRAKGVAAGDGRFSIKVPFDFGDNPLSAVERVGAEVSSPGNTVVVQNTQSVNRTWSGSISQDTVWTHGNGGAYFLSSNLTIAPGATLWVMPGVELKVTGYYSAVTVNGALRVLGSTAQPVKFVAASGTASAGQWTGIVVNASATEVLIEHAEIRNAIKAVEFNASSGTVRKSLLIHSTTGLYARDGATPQVIDGNTITANHIGVEVHTQQVSNSAKNPMPVVTGNAIYGNNSYNYRGNAYANPDAARLNARGNYWGTTDVGQIAHKIYDRSDYYNHPVIDFAGYLTAEGQPAFAGSSLNGQILSDLTLSAGVHQIEGYVRVAQGATLTLEAGAELQFPYSQLFVVDGSLRALGTAAQPVKFLSSRTSPAAGHWPGIVINASANDVLIEYAEVRHAAKALEFNGSSGTVRQSLLSQNSTAIYARDGATPQVVDGNTITANQTGIEVYTSQPSNLAKNPAPLLSGNAIYGNSGYNYRGSAYANPDATRLDARGNYWGTTDVGQIANKIYDRSDYYNYPVIDFSGYLSADGQPAFAGGSLNGQVLSNLTLGAGLHQVEGYVRVAPGATLTLAAGAELQFPYSQSFVVDGSLRVLGTQAQPVKFVSSRVAPAAGHWPGILINASANNVLVEHAEIRHATKALEFNASTGIVRRSLLTQNTIAIHARDGATPQVIDGNSITANRDGVEVSTSQPSNPAKNPLPVVTGNRIYSNSGYNFRGSAYANPDTTRLNARGNDWGTTDVGQIASKIYDRSDYYNHPVIDFAGYLTAEGSPAFSGNSLNGPLLANTTLGAGLHQVEGYVRVAPGATLTLLPGAELQFPYSQSFVVDGSLRVLGTQAQPVKFLSSRASPAAGHWPGILINAGANDVLIEHADIRHAVRAVEFNASSGTIRKSLLTQNTIGVYARDAATPQVIDGNTISGNFNGVEVYNLQSNNPARNPQPVVTGNAIHGNSNFNYRGNSYANSANVSLNARGNYWGTTDPYAIAQKIDDRADTPSFPEINYCDYLDQPGGTPYPGVYAVRTNAMVIDPSVSQAGNIEFTTNSADQLEVIIKKLTSGEVVYSEVLDSPSCGKKSFQWSGQTLAGQVLDDGVYVTAFRSTSGSQIVEHTEP
ncbi:FlgD immunoglobulin-like domain containing protein, partial [Pseudomarimonas arenosa]